MRGKNTVGCWTLLRTWSSTAVTPRVFSNTTVPRIGVASSHDGTAQPGTWPARAKLIVFVRLTYAFAGRSRRIGTCNDSSTDCASRVSWYTECPSAEGGGAYFAISVADIVASMLGKK